MAKKSGGKDKASRLKKLTPEDLAAVEACLDRTSSDTDRPYFRTVLLDMLRNNAVPVDLLEDVPAPVREVGKTRFDQLYDAAASLIFPGYSQSVLDRLLGPDGDQETKIWRVMLPEEFGIRHVLIRARSFQQAFAFGCDYACRLSLRLYRKIPVDLTVRVAFMSDKALRRMLYVRWKNREKKRNELKIEGRVFTTREVSGARNAAVGKFGSSEYSIALYAERQDLSKILKAKDLSRCTVVEYESMKGKGGAR